MIRYFLFLFLPIPTTKRDAEVIQAPVVQKVNNAISIHWIVQLVSGIVIRWIVIYPLDSAIQFFEQPGLWGTNFQHGGKFVPQNNPTMYFDNHLTPVSRAISKCLIGCAITCILLRLILA